MTKSELIEQVSELLKLPNGKAEQIVNCIFDSMVKALQEGEGIEIRGFGSFTVREYKSYDGRNPRTGDTVHVSPKRLPFFKVGKDLRERVNIAASAHAAKMQRFAAEAAAAASQDRMADASRSGGQPGDSRSGGLSGSTVSGGSAPGGLSGGTVPGGLSGGTVSGGSAPDAQLGNTASGGSAPDGQSGSSVFGGAPEGQSASPGENGSTNGEHSSPSSTSQLSGSADERPSEASAPDSDSSSSWK